MTQMIQHALSEEVLDTLMGLFWEKGYSNTSIDELIVATGLNRSILYKFFGGKDKLFLAMLKRFSKNITDQIIIPLQNEENGIEGIKIFFQQFLDFYELINLRSRGCFLISTAIEIHAHNNEVADFVNSYMEKIKSAFRNLLLYSRSVGLLKAEIDVESTADFLVGNLFGAMSLCRSSIPKKVFENHINGVLTFLSNVSSVSNKST